MNAIDDDDIRAPLSNFREEKDTQESTKDSAEGEKDTKDTTVKVSKVSREKRLNLTTPSVNLLVGKPKRGKSHLLRWLLYHFTIDDSVKPKDRFQSIIVFTGSKFNDDFAGMLPDKCIIQMSRENYESILENYLNQLQKVKKARGSIPPTALVFDDVIGLLDSNTDAFSSFISTFRHYNITVFVCVQYVKKNISTTFRECVNHFYLFNSKTELALRAFFESCGQLFDSYQEFKAYFLRATSQPYTALFYNQDEDSREDAYRVIRAPAELPKVQLKY